ncbi:MAG: hypothetical protein M1337_05695 [Actinobacteria bacterium]|nr:hypothetical protein [Actinomycetota bacterium]
MSFRLVATDICGTRLEEMLERYVLDRTEHRQAGRARSREVAAAAAGATGSKG